jgi:hypothetical protein
VEPPSAALFCVCFVKCMRVGNMISGSVLGYGRVLPEKNIYDDAVMLGGSVGFWLWR